MAPVVEHGGQLLVINVDGDDLAGAEGPGDLDDVGAHAAGGDHGDGLPVAQVGAAAHGPVTGHGGAAQDGRRHHVDGVGHGGHGGGGDDRVLGQAAHGVHGHRLTVGGGQAGGAVVEDALEAVEVEEGAAQLVAPRGAGVALTAGHEEAPGHLLPDLQAGVLVAGAELYDGAGDLVAEHRRQREGDGATDDVEVGVAQPAGGHLDENLAALGARSTQRLDLQTDLVVPQDRGLHGLGDGLGRL